MILFSDLDNTLIYSYKHDIGLRKRNVELYQGREISFITEDTWQYLKRLKARIEIVPLSTRSAEQYQRINLGVGEFPYALVCNGGILLKNGQRVESWYEKSLEEIKDSNEEIRKGLALLEKDSRRSFELRYVEELFVFTKCAEAERVVLELREKLDCEYADVFHNGAKVYIVPKMLTKGRALERFMEYQKEHFSIAAGDSEFDISMLKTATLALAPFGFRENFSVDFPVEEMREGKVFSEELLGRCLEITEKQ